MTAAVALPVSFFTARSGRRKSGAKIRTGETVLIHGASGGAGTMAVQLAWETGAVGFDAAGDEKGSIL